MDMYRLNKLLGKMDRCPDYETMHLMEDDFNAVGLTVQPTSSDKMILCVIEGECPRATKILEDYLFVGSVRGGDIITDQFRNLVKEFIVVNASEPSKVSRKSRRWQNGSTMYGEIVVSDDNHTKQAMCESIGTSLKGMRMLNG